MNPVSRKVIYSWASLGSRFMPFADAATPEMPLSRLLRLSLFQVSVGMAMVLLIGTLNRVMIVELGVPASLVAIMLSLPLVFAPFRALIGFRSDTHRSFLGWRRVPFMWQGTLIQFGGLAIMPFALLVLAGEGEALDAPRWIGLAGAGLAFLMVGAGLHTVQTVGLALATDLAPPESQPKIVGLMYVMLLVGMIISAVAFGALLSDFTSGKLIQVIQGSAVITIILNVVALWKQEARNPARTAFHLPQPSFRASWGSFIEGEQALRRLLALGLGTAAFSMQDVLLEPYGGQILKLSVSATTTLTASLAFGGLIGFSYASRVLSRGVDPFRMASFGVLFGMPGFALVILAAPLHAPALFAVGVLLIGFGGGLFSHGTLTATMNLAPRDQVGLALGAWGAVQATAAGAAMALGGVMRDVVTGWAGPKGNGPMLGYASVYALEIALLLAALVVMMPLLRRRGVTAQVV
jgi:BCD family chlorophyll transporter-like MFS transporter